MADAKAYTVETHTASDGYCWRYRHYAPAVGVPPLGGGPEGEWSHERPPPQGGTPTAPHARVVCIHGIQSHGGWYENSCAHLARAGFDVCFLDRRGSGLNEQDRGDAPGFRRLLDDLAEFLIGVRGQGPGVSEENPISPLTPDPWSLTPLFLIAISWGGKLGAALQRRHPGLVDGLVLLCPGFCPRVGLSLRDRLHIVWARIRRPRQLFPIPLNDPELFTANPHRQQFIRDDALGLRQATARLLIESVRLDGYLKVVPGHVQVPVLLMLAGRDRIIDNDRTRRFVERFASADKEVIEYPEAHHTLEFEPEPQPIFADLQGWLERHLKSGGASP